MPSKAARPQPTRLTFEQAKAAARAAGWTTQTAYRANWRQVPGLPGAPEVAYAEWTNWRDFLGNAPLSLEEAMRAVQALGIRTQAEYKRRFQEVPGLPSNPDRTYEAFPGWGSFLGSGRTRRTPTALSFTEARALARQLGLRSYTEYHQAREAEPRLPSAPHQHPEWPGWDEFLGVASPQFLSYEEAGRAARAAGIRTYRDYAQVYKHTPGLPSTPNKTYAEAWRGWRAFLRGE